MHTRNLCVAVFLALAGGGCDVDPVQVGEACDDPGDQLCREPTVALYCGAGHWSERDCWAECRRHGYEVGSCGLHSRYGDETCFCAPDEVWEEGAACAHEGDQSCWAPQKLRICLDGRVREVECADACATSVSSFCGYDAARGDDSCICCDRPTCP